MPSSTETAFDIKLAHDRSYAYAAILDPNRQPQTQSQPQSQPQQQQYLARQPIRAGYEDYGYEEYPYDYTHSKASPLTISIPVPMPMALSLPVTRAASPLSDIVLMNRTGTGTGTATATTPISPENQAIPIRETSVDMQKVYSDNDIIYNTATANARLTTYGDYMITHSYRDTSHNQDHPNILAPLEVEAEEDHQQQQQQQQLHSYHTL